jgi:hypothetical protein
MVTTATINKMGSWGKKMHRWVFNYYTFLFMTAVLLLFLIQNRSRDHKDDGDPRENNRNFLTWTSLESLSDVKHDGLILRQASLLPLAPVYITKRDMNDTCTCIEYYKSLTSMSLQKQKLSLLHLVLYSKDVPEYKDMYQQTSQFYKHMQIKTLYYTFRWNQVEPFLVEGDILYIKGEESLVPGVLEKTLEVLRYTSDIDYDYIIRSNISTVVDFRVLLQRLLQYDRALFHYGGAFTLNLKWIDPPYGIVDQTYWDTTYVSGTCVILSKYIVSLLLNDLKSHIPHDVVDDVALGYVIQKYTIHNAISLEQWFWSLSDKTTKKDIEANTGRVAFYRNKSDSRQHDIRQIHHIIKTISTNP